MTTKTAKRAAVAAALALTLAGSGTALGGTPWHPGQTHRVILSAAVAPGQHYVLHTKVRLPGGTYPVYVDARFNNHKCEFGYPNSKFQVTYAWHGVIVTVTNSRRVAPSTVSIASARTGGAPVHVRVIYTWK